MKKNMKKNNITMKLENVGANKDKTVMIYGLAKFEDKNILNDLFNAFLMKERKLGERLEAWKVCDTIYTFRVAKLIGTNIVQCQVC